MLCVREIKQNSSILVYHFRCIGKRKHVLVALVKGSMIHYCIGKRKHVRPWPVPMITILLFWPLFNLN